MVTDALHPCFARTSAAMILNMQTRWVLVLDEEGFQLPLSCHCGKLIEIKNICSWFCGKI